MENNKKEIKKGEHDLEVVIGDESILNISEVNYCMNTLRPKTSAKKQVIIPVNKKKLEKNKESKRDLKLNTKKSKNDK